MTKLETKLYQAIGQYDEPYTHPPLHARKKYYAQDQLIKFNNDGHEVWFGSSDAWHFHLPHSEFKKVVRWYLYQWIIVDWCGLRTKIWFFLLHRQVRK
jgi:hypothetical protein